MANVPIPERGQPLDISYIATMANAINELNNSISSSTYNYTSIDTSSAGKQNIKTSEARVIGGIYKIDTFSTTAQTTKPFTYSWNQNFKYSPVVTATVINRVSGGAGDDTQVVLTSITNDSVSGIVKFNTAGNNIQVSVNLIIIGIPE